MATKTLVIDGTDREHFFLTVDRGTLRIGDTAAHPEGVVRDMHIVRIHCEVELEEDREHVAIDEPGVLAPSTLRLGAAVKLAHANLSLITGNPPAPTIPVPANDIPLLDLSLANPESNEVPQAAAPTVVARRFKVIDGGDQGRTFKLPDEGTVTIGKTGHATIGLHDLYVSKIHCSLQIDGYGIHVTHVEGQTGTLIDGTRITGPQKLRSGSVLRMGNSHLKLEQGPFADEPAEKLVEPVAAPGASGVRRLLAQSVPEASKDPLLQLQGQTLGNFKLDRVLGRGFSGAVFYATHAKTGQAFALKVLAPEFPAANAELERFAQEIKAIQPIRHVNLLTIHGAGKSGSHCWFAREMVDGESAADVVRRIAVGEKPSWTRAARVAVHLARALEALQDHRLVHGNITPRNVLLREDNITKLADLRLAQALDGSQLQRSILESKLLAELPYLAPEQANPDAFVDGLADLYAVGAVAYSLVTGRPPVNGNSPVEILERLQEGRILRPSAVYKKVPAEFDAIVMKLLARNQEDRYQTATALLNALEPLGQSYDLKL